MSKRFLYSLLFFLPSLCFAQVAINIGVSRSSNSVDTTSVKKLFAVENFGAVGDGVTDDAAAIQAAVNYSFTTTGGKIEFTKGKTYFIGSSINIPYLAPSGSIPMYIFEGNGATLKTTAAIAMISKAVANQTQASIAVNSKVVVNDLRLEGNNTAAQVGIKIQASYGSEFNRCTGRNLDEFIHLEFALNTAISHCQTNNSTSYDYYVRWGTWTGAGKNNSASNCTIIEGCRSFCKTGQLAAVKFLDASGCAVRDCIIEGFNPVRAIDFDADGGTTIKHFYVENTHVENTPSECGVYLRPNGGSVYIRGYYSQYAHTMFKTASDALGNIVIEDLQYITAGSKFQALSGAGYWLFKDLNWQMAQTPGTFYSTYFEDADTTDVPFYKNIQSNNGVQEDITIRNRASLNNGNVVFNQSPNNIISSSNLYQNAGAFMSDVYMTNGKTLSWQLTGHNDATAKYQSADSTLRLYGPGGVALSNTTPGFRLPQMTKAERNAIPSPPDGTLIYQTDNTPGLRVRENGVWVKYTSTAD